MSLKILLLTFAAALITASCTSSRNISYTEARNYFVSNDAPQPVPVKIVSPAVFERYFGTAAFMGRDGQCTPIDFERQMVVTTVLPPTDTATTVTPIALKKTGSHQLTFQYKVVRGARQSYTLQPFLLLIIDRTYRDHTIRLEPKQRP